MRIDTDDWGNILIGHSGGLCKYIPESDSFGKTLPPSGDPLGGDSNQVTSIRRIDADKFLIGTRRGIVAEFNESTNSFRRFLPKNLKVSPERVHDFYPIGNGKYYVGTDTGMYILDTVNGDWEQCDNEIASESIYRFYVDREDGLWIGTYFCGVNYSPLLLESIDCYTDDGTQGSLKGTAVSEFCPDGKGNIWIGTENGGLNRFNIATKTFTDFSALSHNNIHALCLDGQHLWIGTFSKGMDCLDLRTMNLKNYSHSQTDSSSLCDDFVYSILKSGDGLLYVGTLSGLCILNPQTGKFRKVKEIGTGFICDLCEDSSGNVWAADRNCGLYVLGNGGRELIHFAHDDSVSTSLPDNQITGICMDGMERMWFCTKNGGICRYDEGTGGFISFGPAEGLPKSIYYGLLDDGTGSLWLSSNRGLIKYNPQTRKVHQYTVEDGLQSNQFNFRSYLKTDDGKMYFGGVSGFNCFYPVKLTKNEVSPKVSISGVRARFSGKGKKGDDGQRNSAAGIIRLPHNTISVDIDIDCLSYAAPSRNLISWKMGGVNSEWVITDVKTVSFSNLKAGKHHFSAKACNNDGVWSEDCAEVDIVVSPHPLLSWWAVAAYMLVGAGICLGIEELLRRRKKEKDRQKLVEAKVEFFNQIFQNVNIHSDEVVKSISTSPDNDAKWMEKLNGVIRDNLGNGEFNIDLLAAEMSASRSFLQRKMKAMLGMTPNDYLKMVRLKAAKELLSTGQYRVNEVCWMTGFNSLSYFTKCFSKQFGMLPKNCSGDIPPDEEEYAGKIENYQNQ